MLLVPALLVLLHHDKGELLLLEVQPSDLGPEEQTNLLGPLVHQDTCNKSIKAAYSVADPDPA